MEQTLKHDGTQPKKKKDKKSYTMQPNTKFSHRILVLPFSPNMLIINPYI